MSGLEKTQRRRNVVLDSGAIIGLARGDTETRAVVGRLKAAKCRFHVPVVVQTETLRGGSADVAVHRILNDIEGELPVSGVMARRAGTLIGETGSRAGVADALVAAVAVSLVPSVVVTSDPDDLRLLVRDHPDVTVYPV